jgi:hypothetical protein
MGLKKKIFSEFKTYWVNVLYIALFFTIFTSYKRLILAHYQIVYGEYGISLIKALVLAKIILVAEHLHLGRGLENRPLVYPTLYKSFLFTVCVAIVNIIEFMIRGFLKAKELSGATDMFMEHFSYEWVAWMLATFIVFIPFFAIRELGRVLGRGKISELFFNKKTSAGVNNVNGQSH